MKPGVQSLGWYVLRAPDPVPLIRFYRDTLGLSTLRGRETPPEEASAMLWADGTTVFEPNRLAAGGTQGGPPDALDDSPFVPVFNTVDPAATETRIKLKPDTTRGAIRYYRDPLGFFFGLEPTDASPAHPPPADIEPLAADITGLGRLEYRVQSPDQVAAFYGATLGLKRLDGDGSRLDMGDGAILDIFEGGTEPAGGLDDREQASQVPVFRLYGYSQFKTLMDNAGVSCLQEVELTGGLLWYGWDPAGHLFGFQERKPPDPDPDKWTTRLAEDLLARELWADS